MSDNIIQLNEDLIKHDFKNLARSSVEETLNALLDKEADEPVNAGKYERSAQRQGYRSGHYKRNFQTTAGVSVRRVEDITGALWGTKVSPGTISNLNKKAYEHIEQWRIRPFTDNYPYVYVDGVYLKRGRGGKKLSAAAKKLTDGIEETLTCMDFPGRHRTRIRTNNTIERLNREIKRRTKAIGAFPDGQSVLMLVCAGLRHVEGTQWGTRRYMNMEHLTNH